MGVAWVVLEPVAAQTQSLGHYVQLLKPFGSEVIARHVAPVQPAAWAVIVASNIVHENHVVGIVA